jgi:hypothetical protein
MLQLGFAEQEIIRISLWFESSLLRFLNIVFISLPLCKRDGIFLGSELYTGTLHVISTRLPSHERIFPSVPLVQDIPVHSPGMLMPRSGLHRILSLSVDTDVSKLEIFGGA